jgi:hypothetical protein
MNLVESKDFISKELLDNFLNDVNILQKFYVTHWDKSSSIYLKYKVNEDGFVLSLIPFVSPDSIEESYYLTIMLVDSQKMPSSLGMQFFKCETNTIEKIKKYIFSIFI